MSAETASAHDPAATADAPLAPLSCRAVLTHHWLLRLRGGEKVLEALCELLPQSPIYTFVHDPHEMGDGWPPVHTSFLQRFPGVRRYYRALSPLMPCAARAIQLPPVDLVVCSDAALAKAMRPHPRSRVVCYCHSPMRYVWDLYETYRARLPWLLRPLWSHTAAKLREADRRAAEQVHVFVANSRHVAKRIERHYGRESTVVYPPVDLPAAPSTTRREDYYLCVGHHVPYKRLDLAVAACRELGRRLVVIGSGPDIRRLALHRDQHVETLGWQPDHVVHEHYRRAAGLLFPGEEDFGIVPVEAMAHGCPVLAYAVGGATETVVDGETGVWFDQQTTEGLADAIQRREQMSFDPQAMHAQMRRFSRQRFLAQMREILLAALSGR
ncbi:MAG: glycosyltransferase [Planctomycetes bacterium]|nr:glycosyltransferase [Planctomycetota bacterium]